MTPRSVKAIKADLEEQGVTVYQFFTAHLVDICLSPSGRCLGASDHSHGAILEATGKCEAIVKLLVELDKALDAEALGALLS